MGRADILNMLRALIVVGIEKLPPLGVGDTAQGFLSQDKIDAYVASLEKNLDTGIEKLVKNVLGGEIDEIEKDVFIANMCKKENEKIVFFY